MHDPRLALVEDAVARIDPGRERVRLEEPVAEAVDGGDPGAVKPAGEVVPVELAQPPPDPAAQLPAARSVYVITRIESTSSPRSQTARQKRSTMTVVLPVPAPAETKTTPGSSIARVCSRFGTCSMTVTTS